jgi:hypothetical protein
MGITGRKRKRAMAAPEPATAVIAKAARQMRMLDYGDGVVDGMIEALGRLTGEKPGGPPNLPDDVRFWAEDALRRGREQKAQRARPGEQR